MGLKSSVWIAAGIILAFSATIFYNIDKNGFYMLFFAIGVLFFIIGVLKALFEKDEKKAKKKKPKITGTLRCPSCKALNHDTTNFCHACGYQLKPKNPQHSWL